MKENNFSSVATALVICLLASALGTQPTMVNPSSDTRLLGLTEVEQQIVHAVNGSKASAYDLELENISLNHYAFRAAGSKGADEAANTIKQKLESFGLEAWLEPFTFTTWDLSAKPFLALDDDGNRDTVYDRVNVTSFQALHYSWPTPPEGIFADLVMLPLPDAANKSDLGSKQVNMNAWNQINTQGKILLIGVEVNWCNGGQQAFLEKINSQPPAAIVRTWWFPWMSFVPDVFSSGGGRPVGDPYYWNLNIPVGFVNHEDGMRIRNRESSYDVSAQFSITSAIGTGTHYNVVGRILGAENPEKMILLTGHYDTVMCTGFCDNGAGTAGILELARVFSDAVNNCVYWPRYTLLFVAFTAEELGLVGAINYIRMHKSDMPNVVAVLNMDCIGSDDFYYTETDPSGALDLDSVVVQAAQDLGVPAGIEAPGGSDHEVFRDPSWAQGYHYWSWGVSADISDAAPVSSSIMLISRPLLYTDLWDIGEVGWIHTSNDNSTSTGTLSWVEEDDLESHIEIAALTVVRISPNVVGPVDLAVLDIVPLKTVVGTGYTMRVNVTVQNQGATSAAFRVTLSANATVAGTFAVALPAGNRFTLVISWNASGFVKGNYTVGAAAQIFPVETDPADNSRNFGGYVFVTVAGDVTSYWGPPEGKVDMRDIGLVCGNYGRTASSPYWNPNMDIDDDGVVDMRDIGIACNNYGKR